MLSGATRAPRQGTVGQGRIEPPDIWPAGCATVPKPLDPVPGQQGVAAGVDAERGGVAESISPAANAPGWALWPARPGAPACQPAHGREFERAALHFPRIGPLD